MGLVELQDQLVTCYVNQSLQIPVQARVASPMALASLQVPVLAPAFLHSPCLSGHSCRIALKALHSEAAVSTYG